MACCYETCVDKGDQWSVSKDRIFCFNCGKPKPHYNITSENSGAQEQTQSESSKQSLKEGHRSKHRCKCKESCKEWILSFLGFGKKLPRCCEGTPISAWDSGDVARTVLTGKLQGVVKLFNAQEQPLYVRRSSTVTVHEDYQDDIKKSDTPLFLREVVKSAEGETKEQASLKEQAQQESGKRQTHSVFAIRRKKRRSTNVDSKTSIPFSDTESRIRLKLEIFDREITKRTSESHSPPPSDPLLSPNRSKLRARPTTSDVFNPFQRRLRTYKCSRLDKLKSLFCPHLPCIPCPKFNNRILVKCFLERKAVPQSICKSTLRPNCNDQPKNADPPSINKTVFDTCKQEQPAEVRRSQSMPCTSCCCASKPVKSRFCKCDPGILCGGPKLPCRSQSFHSTLLRSPSPVAVVMPQLSPCCRPCAVSTCRPRNRKFKCSCSLERCTKKSGSSSRSSCTGYKSNAVCKERSRHKSPGCCTERKSVCCSDQCHYGSKPPLTLCPPCCTKPCCLPCPRKFTVLPYCPRLEATSRVYLSIPNCTMRSGCPCPVGGPCSCPMPARRPLPLPCCPYSINPSCKIACSTATAISYIKAKQNDAICQRLLTKYGFSPPVCHPCPAPCYGTVSEGLCPPPTCATNTQYTYSGGSSGGCKSCTS